MRALTVKPGTPNSIQLDDVAPPPESDGAVLVRALALGICGTDREIIAGHYGWAPPGKSASSSAMNRSAASKRRRPALASSAAIWWSASCGGPIRCRARPARPASGTCAATANTPSAASSSATATAREHFRVEPDFLIKIDPALDALGVLLEPTSVVAKAWEHIERIGARAPCWKPRVALVTGAGPVGLAGGADRRASAGCEVHVLDRSDDGPKAGAWCATWAPPITPAISASSKPDIVIECTGAGSVVLDVLRRTAPDGIVCLAGVSSGGHKIEFDIGEFNRDMVLQNDVVFGSVNANRRHYRGRRRGAGQGRQGLARPH